MENWTKVKSDLVIRALDKRLQAIEKKTKLAQGKEKPVLDKVVRFATGSQEIEFAVLLINDSV